MSFLIENITAAGCTGMGCHPMLLPRMIVGDQLVIQKTNLSDQRFVFLRDDEQAMVHSVNMTDMVIPMSSISENATWYQFEVSGSLVRFFAVMDGNGTVHTAFDDCPMCYASHQGFRQNGSEMVENCCNMAFPIENITALGCSGMMCHPTYLANQVIGDQVVLAISDLDARSYMFP